MVICTIICLFVLTECQNMNFICKYMQMSNDANTNIDTIMEYVPSGKNYAKFPYVKSSERKRRFVYHRIDHNGVKKFR